MEYCRFFFEEKWFSWRKHGGFFVRYGVLQCYVGPVLSELYDIHVPFSLWMRSLRSGDRASDLHL